MPFKKNDWIKLILGIVIVFIAAKLIFYTDFLPGSILYIINMLSPIFWGFSIAYILNPAVSGIERKFMVSRWLSMLLVYSLLVVVAVICIAFFIPLILTSMMDMYIHIPEYITKADIFFKEFSKNTGIMTDYDIKSIFQNNIYSIMNFIQESFSGVLSSGFSVMRNATNSLYILSMSLLLSVYFLNDKEKFIDGIKKVLYIFFKKKKTDGIIAFGREVNQIFSGYFTGKLLESLIISVICMLFFRIMGMKNVLFFSVFIGITNLIPYIGPFIGAVPPVIISLFDKPLNALWITIFIMVLQQVDGIYIGPKVVGDKVGLSPFWVTIAVIIGGSLFGFIGILISAPLFAALKILLVRYINSKAE